MKKKFILVTGCAGFIGFHVCERLLKKNINVLGIDSLNSYYDVSLKKNRVKILKKYKNFTYKKLDISNKKKFFQYIKKFKYDYIIHLAAQAGVRYSIIDPYSYTRNNIEAFLNILELSRSKKIKHLIYASTSSVYGANQKLPLKETDNVDHPIQFYAATKRSNELMAHAYSHLYKIPSTGVRFFTVYGPWGRPDMALFQFVFNIVKNKKIQLFNSGDHYRSFTYIDDVVTAVIKLIYKIPKISKRALPNQSKVAPFRIINIGNYKSESLKKYLEIIQKKLGKKAKIINLPLQAGDIKTTLASIQNIKSLTGFVPSTKIYEGIGNFISWFKKYY
ncbi:NAD-dependent epimerase/dehydratase family protein [Pelagibacteraceae bacterium]|nr:NAD-dependent epimerase/dehydratase family protein [Pelagibacteraceae bacterium]